MLGNPCWEPQETRLSVGTLWLGPPLAVPVGSTGSSAASMLSFHFQLNFAATLLRPVSHPPGLAASAHCGCSLSALVDGLQPS